MVTGQAVSAGQPCTGKGEICMGKNPSTQSRQGDSEGVVLILKFLNIPNQRKVGKKEMEELITGNSFLFLKKE